MKDIGRYLFRSVLALPAIAMFVSLARGTAAGELLHGSGELSARLLIVALAVSPLALLLPDARWVRWLRRERRALGVAAFGYAVLHTVLYFVDMETLANVLAEIGALGIWTGWVALVVFAALAATSNDTAVRLLGRYWKVLHRTVYAAAALTLLHWIYVHNNLVGALVHFVPIILLEIYRVLKTTASNPIPGP